MLESAQRARETGPFAPRVVPASAIHEGPWLAVQAFLANVARGEYRVYSAHAGLPGMTLLYSTGHCPDVTQ